MGTEIPNFELQNITNLALSSGIYLLSLIIFVVFIDGVTNGNDKMGLGG